MGTPAQVARSPWLEWSVPERALSDVQNRAEYGAEIFARAAVRVPNVSGWAEGCPKGERGKDQLFSRLFVLRCVPNGKNRDPVSSYPVNDDVGSSADYQFAGIRLSAGPPEIGMSSQGFHDRNYARCQAVRRCRLVHCHVRMNFPQSHPRQDRPDDFYWHSVSSCGLPHTHFGGGNSLFVPQDSSQAFMSSCLM